LNLDAASTPYATYSDIQLDPIEEKYSAENSAAYGSFTRGELQQLILTSQEQIKVDLHDLHDEVDEEVGSTEELTIVIFIHEHSAGHKCQSTKESRKVES